MFLLFWMFLAVESPPRAVVLTLVFFLLFWMFLAVESPPRAVVLTLVFSHRGTHPAVSF